MTDNDREMIESLRALIEVEVQIINNWPLNMDEYVLGRLGAYKFILMAMDNRWPREEDTCQVETKN